MCLRASWPIRVTDRMSRRRGNSVGRCSLLTSLTDAGMMLLFAQSGFDVLGTVAPPPASAAPLS
jgi:hypothetical protein